MLTANQIALVLAGARERGEPVAIVSIVEPPGADRLLVAADGTSVAGTLGSPEIDEKARIQAVEILRDERQEITTVTIDGLRALIEVSRPPLELIVCGGGHVGRAVAMAARFLDFAVTVIDDRADFASRERFPDENVRVIANDFVQALRSISITPASHIVIVTRGHRHDQLCLREVIERPARYIGMIGSRRRTTTIREHMRKEGVGMELLKRVHAPIGLDIGAQTPEEIALAIISEIVLVRRGGTGAPKGARMLYKDAQ